MGNDAMKEIGKDIETILAIKIENDDGQNSNVAYMTIYDSICIKCHVQTLPDKPANCELRKDTCSANGQCFNLSENHPNSNCSICGHGSHWVKKIGNSCKSLINEKNH